MFGAVLFNLLEYLTDLVVCTSISASCYNMIMVTLACPTRAYGFSLLNMDMDNSWMHALF